MTVTIEIIGFDAGLKISFRLAITTTKRSIAGLERPEPAPWETARLSAVALVQKPHRHRYNHTVDNKEDEKVFQQSHLPEGSRIDEVRLAAQTVKPVSSECTKNHLQCQAPQKMHQNATESAVSRSSGDEYAVISFPEDCRQNTRNNSVLCRLQRHFIRNVKTG